MNKLTDDHGLSAHLEALEAITAPGDTENQQLICLLLELKHRRTNQSALEAELQEYRNAQQVVPDFGALTKLIVQRLVDCGGADDDAIARCEEFVYNACRAGMQSGAAPKQDPI